MGLATIVKEVPVHPGDAHSDMNAGCTDAKIGDPAPVALFNASDVTQKAAKHEVVEIDDALMGHATTVYKVPVHADNAHSDVTAGCTGAVIDDQPPIARYNATDRTKQAAKPNVLEIDEALGGHAMIVYEGLVHCCDARSDITAGCTDTVIGYPLLHALPDVTDEKMGALKKRFADIDEALAGLVTIVDEVPLHPRDARLLRIQETGSVIPQDAAPTTRHGRRRSRSERRDVKRAHKSRGEWSSTRQVMLPRSGDTAHKREADGIPSAVIVNSIRAAQPAEQTGLNASFAGMNNGVWDPSQGTTNVSRLHVADGVERVLRVPQPSFVSGSAKQRRGSHVHDDRTGPHPSHLKEFERKTSAVTHTDKTGSAIEDMTGDIQPNEYVTAHENGSFSAIDGHGGSRKRFSRIKRGLRAVRKTLRRLLTCTPKYH